MPSISRIETWTGRRAFLPVAAAGLLLSLASGSAAPAPSPSPAGPPAADALPDPAARAEVELNAFTLAPGWRIELVAADALVGSPLGLQFSPDGRLWVLEAGGGPPAGEAEAGRGGGLIAVLEDADGDGRMDRRTLFATGLKAPRGLVLLGNGALVLDGTEFWFLRDRDGDAVADERSKVAADPDDVRDRRAGSRRLVWSIDNWIYAADSTTRLRYYGSGGFARDFTDRRPGRSVATDEVGRLYYSGDARFLHADRIPSGYRWRNPGAGAGDERWGLPVEPALNGAAAPLADLLIYRGATLGAGWDGVVLVAESGRLVGCRLPSGGGRPGPAGPGETGIVLVTAPSQVRLAGMAQGFDGALYVAGQVDGGAASGRIWRLRPAIVTGRAGKFSGSVPLAELVNDLAHADGWRRDTAQRLIIEREDPGAARLVREFALGATSPIGRVHALWTLEGLEAVDRETVLRLLDDADPRVCSTAVRQAEKFLYAPADEGVLARLVRLARHPDAAVRLQLVLTLGEAARPESDAVLAEALVGAADQPAMVEAVISGIGGREWEFITALASKLPAGNLAATKVVTAATVRLLAGTDLRRMILKDPDRARLNRLFELVAEQGTPGWIRTAIMDGVDRYVPVDRTGRRLRVNLAVEPEPLVRFAARGDAESLRVRRLLLALNWPGKPVPADLEAPVLEGEDLNRFEKGRVAYPITCGGCHQPRGQGLAGLAPPLAGSRWVQGDARILARIILCGKIQEIYPMPALRGAFDDETIAAVLTFVRKSWGNHAPGVSPADVAAARAATADRNPIAFTDFELLELADELARP